MVSEFINKLLQSKIFGITLLAIGSMGIFLVVMEFIPYGSDYYYHFRPLAEQWFNNQPHMYDGPAERLFYPPWSLFVILPIGLFSIKAGHAFLFLVSALSLILAVHLLSKIFPLPRYGWILAVVNLHSFDLFIRGQIDGPILIGVVLGLWAVQQRRPFMLGIAFVLMTLKPPMNVLLPCLLYLVSIRRWSRQELIRVFSLPLLTLIVSSLVLGFDWPLVALQNAEGPVNYLSISLWRGAALLGLPGWIVALPALVAAAWFIRIIFREGTTEYTVGLALTINFTFTLYANGDHYILLIPAFLYVARRNWRLAFLAYLTTWTPLLRLPLGYDAAVLDVFYPLILLLSIWWLERNSKPVPVSTRPSALHEAD